MNLTKEEIRNKLNELHTHENQMNQRMENCLKEIKALKHERKKLARKISGNMRFRNKLINLL